MGSEIASCTGHGVLQDRRLESMPGRLLQFSESGEMRMAAHPTVSNTFMKKYVYVFSSENDKLTLQIFFDNGPRSDETAPFPPEDLYCAFDLSTATEGVAIRSTEHL